MADLHGKISERALTLSVQFSLSSYSLQSLQEHLALWDWCTLLEILDLIINIVILFLCNIFLTKLLEQSNIILTSMCSSKMRTARLTVSSSVRGGDVCLGIVFLGGFDPIAWWDTHPVGRSLDTLAKTLPSRNYCCGRS